MSTSSLEELHPFAETIGLKREWFQEFSGVNYHPHYDLTTMRMIQKAIRAGAEQVSPKVIVAHFRELRELNDG